MLVKLLIVALLVLAAWLLFSRSFSRSSRRRPAHRSAPPRKLISLLNGDTAAAHRLFDNAQQRDPGQSNQWYWEKVTWDLERDRRW